MNHSMRWGSRGRLRHPVRRLLWLAIWALSLCACGKQEVEEATDRTQQALCTQPTLAVSPSGVIPAAGSAQLSANATCSGAATEYAFRFRRENEAAWTELRPYGAAATATFSASGRPPGRYEVSVLARSQGSSVAFESTSSALVLVGAVCHAAHVAGPPGPPAEPGATVTVTATATCTPGAQPEFLYFWSADGSGALHQLGTWQSGPLEWSTAGLGSARYRVIVHARAVGNLSTLESTDYVYFNVGHTCHQVSASANPPSSPIGPTITLTGAASCSGAAEAEYKFEYRRVGTSTSTLLRTWGAATYDWSTANLVAGRYDITVSTRGKNNLSRVEASGTTSVQLGEVCNGVALTPLNFAIPPPIGTNIPVSANATCTSGQAQYLFTFRERGGTEIGFRDWALAPNAQWSTANLASGMYNVTVYVRRSGNTSPYEAMATDRLLIGQTCHQVSLQIAGTTFASGTRITLGANATCTGGTAVYRYYYRAGTDPSAPLVLIRDWGPASSEWDTASLPPGAYQVVVQTRNQANNPLNSESSTSRIVTLTEAVVDCSSELACSAACPCEFGRACAADAQCRPGLVCNPVTGTCELGSTPQTCVKSCSDGGTDGCGGFCDACPDDRVRNERGQCVVPAITECVYQTHPFAVGRDGQSEPLIGRNPKSPRGYVHLRDVPVSTLGPTCFDDAFGEWPGFVSTTGLAWANLDGDEEEELVIARDMPHFGHHRLEIRDNLHAGQRTLAFLLQDELDNMWARALAAGSLDDDPQEEIAVAIGSRVVIFDDRTQGFAKITEIEAGYYGADSLAIADTDGDGKNELFIARSGELSGERRVFVVQDETQGFVVSEFAQWGNQDDRPATAIAIGDFEGDGTPEIAVGRGEGDGVRVVVHRFDPATQQYPEVAAWGQDWGTNHYATSMAFGDFDGDGGDELAVGRNGCALCDPVQKVIVYGAPKVGSEYTKRAFLPSTYWDGEISVRSMATGDVDGNGNPDLLVGTTEWHGDRVTVFQNPLIDFTTSYAFGNVWGDDRVATALAVSKVPACETRVAPTMPSLEVAVTERTSREDEVILTWINQFLPQLQPGVSAEELFSTPIACVKPDEIEKQAKIVSLGLNRIQAGLAAIQLSADPNRTALAHAGAQLLARGFLPLANQWIRAHVTMHKPIGTSKGLADTVDGLPIFWLALGLGSHLSPTLGISLFATPLTLDLAPDGDFDFEMMDIMSTLQRFGTATLADGQPLLDAETVLALTLFDRCDDDLAPEQCVSEPIPVSGNLPIGLTHVTTTFDVDKVPESENHVFMINTWAYLANQWVRENPRDNPELLDEQVNPAHENDGSRLEALLLSALGRTMKNGFFETNARPYQSLSLRAIWMLAAYAHGAKVKTAATNAMDLALATFAMQSLHGKRLPPMRRNSENRDKVGLYANDHLYAISAAITGATVTDRSPACIGTDSLSCAYASNASSYALEVALAGDGAAPLGTDLDPDNGPSYRAPALLQDLLLAPDNHRPGFGIWSRMQARFSEEHYTMWNEPNYPWPNGIALTPTLDLEGPMADGTLPVEPAQQVYFITKDYVNSAGGELEVYEPFADFELVDFEAAHQDDVFSKPTTLIGSHDTGRWGGFRGMAHETLAFGGGSPYLPQTGVFKNFAYGHAPSGSALKLPWRVAQSPALLTATIGDATFRVIDSRFLDKIFARSVTASPAAPDTDYYLVVAELAPQAAGVALGLWEVVPKRLFASANVLLDRVAIANAPNNLVAGAPYVYTLAVSGERLTLNPLYGLRAQAPFLAIDGDSSLVAGLHMVRTPAGVNAYPLLEARQVDANYRLTNEVYACAVGNGLVVIRNPALDKQLVLDSRDHMNPKRGVFDIDGTNLCTQVLSRTPLPAEIEAGLHP